MGTMEKPKTDAPKTEAKKLHDIVSGFRSAMLVTATAEGELRSRPMAIAKVENDDDVWFATRIESTKVDEIKKDSHVGITLQEGQKFASISGKAEVIRDQAKVRELWNEAWKVWFPEGKDDPSLALVKVHAVRGEYWDTAGINRVRYLFEAAKAYVTGTEPKELDGMHGTVTLKN